MDKQKKERIHKISVYDEHFSKGRAKKKE